MMYFTCLCILFDECKCLWDLDQLGQNWILEGFAKTLRWRLVHKVFGWNGICQRNLTLKELEWNVVRFDHLFGWQSWNGIS